MNKKKGWLLIRRKIATIMAALMVFSFGLSGQGVRAASIEQPTEQPTEQPGYVTITVTDEELNPIQGAMVSYTITKDPSASVEDPFETIDGSGTTDEQGVVEVLAESDYISDCLLISASVSKSDYDTDTTTISSMQITSATENFSVQLSKTIVLLTIEEVTITTLEADYINRPQKLVTSVHTETEDVTVEYSTDQVDWSERVPKEKDAGDYTVYVRVSKEGYETYESGALTAKIKPIDIQGIDIRGRECTYIEDTSQRLVNLLGHFESTDTVVWSDNDTPTESRDIPTGMAAGTYTIKLEVSRGSNYKVFTKEVTTTIKNAELDLAGLRVVGLNSTYTGEAQNAVTVVTHGAYELVYQLDDGSEAPNDNAWNAEIPTVTDAGSYIVWVKAVKDNYNDKNVEVIPAENAVAPYNVYIARADQKLEFTNSEYNNEYSLVGASLDELIDGKTYDFSATDVSAVSGGAISYSIELKPVDDGIAEIDATTGKLIVTGAGKVIVKAALAENSNYNGCTIQHILNISAEKENEGEYISFSESSISYVLGNKEGIAPNSLSKTHPKDTGSISYEIENAKDLGVQVATSGAIIITDYSKVIGAIEETDGELLIAVKASKSEVRGWRNTVKWPEDSNYYTLHISLRDAPNEAYTIYDVADLQTPLTGPNGTNGWYNTAIEVKPLSGYLIARNDKISADASSFSTSTRYGEIQDFKAKDQGDNDRIIYLRHSESGEITKKVVLSVEKLDNVKPCNFSIEFPDVAEKDNIKYYGDAITITFTGYDDTSGISKFYWKYTKADGSSDSILDTDSGVVDAIVDDKDSTKYVGTLTLPKNQADQLKGNLEISATDLANNKSDTYTDTGVFVIDTIAPTQTVTYQLKDGEGASQTVDAKHYFSNDVVFTFDIVEANFFQEDVSVYVSKNGELRQLQTIEWSKTGKTDEHEAKLSLTEDGDYIVSMTYEDRSGKLMTSYTSETIVVDKTIPTITFDYVEHGSAGNSQNAVITIMEHNFRASDIQFSVISRDITGQVIMGNDLQEYLRNCSWASSGDLHTATISQEFVDAIYEVTLNYMDLALNEAAGVGPEKFIVDRTPPSMAGMSITYSDPLFDTILSAITFGYYNPMVSVTFTGHDNISGISSFTWNYMKESGVSDLNVSAYTDMSASAIQDGADRTKFTATITLPRDKAEQLRGNIAFSATDRSNNSSNKLTDYNHVIVVDTIAPTMSVEYTEADHTAGGKDYYNKSLTATFTVTEANFYPEDVKVQLKKNGSNPIIINPTWTDGSKDIHIGTYTIEAKGNHLNDADYVFVVEYTDRSKNEMTYYASDIKVMDTTAPIISVEYSDTNPASIMTDSEGHKRKYFASENIATIMITERNFQPEDVKYTIVAKDIAGNLLNVDSLHTKSSWVTNGDEHEITITYPGDANYTFDIAYTDLAKLESADYERDYFTVDTTKPTNLQVTYSAGVLDTVLSAITFGFYNEQAMVTVTATDKISGIKSIKRGYVTANEGKGKKTSITDDSEIQITDDGATGTLVFEIPKGVLESNNQFNGMITFTALDRSNNESSYLDDTKRIVVDNITPTANVEYNSPVQQVGKVSYYDGDISTTISIKEANFFEEDVKVTVIKNEVANGVTVDWSSAGTDIHKGTFVITGDGSYQVHITYTDKSLNRMQEYTSEQMVIDTKGTEAIITVNGELADGKAYKDDVIPAISFKDTNFESYQVKLLRTSLNEKNIDVTDKFIANEVSTDESGGSGTFDTFKKVAENDGIYQMDLKITDKAGHTTEKKATFTVNRYGSIYEYSDYLVSMIANGGAYVQSVNEDFVITEYNADRLVEDSLDIEISRDGKPLDQSVYSVTPEINENVPAGESGWFQYSYTISKDNFQSDGTYKIAVSSKDQAGNTPENTNYKDILFRVDTKSPEVTSITGLEDHIINTAEQNVKYVVYDTIGLNSIAVYVGDKEVDRITDFANDSNNYSGVFALNESSNMQTVRLVVEDMAGNITDTSANNFESSYVFNDSVIVSTNIFVRWFANKKLFFGSIGGAVAVLICGIGAVVIIKKRKRVKS